MAICRLSGTVAHSVLACYSEGQPVAEFSYRRQGYDGCGATPQGLGGSEEPPNRLRTGKLSLATDVGDVLCRKSGSSNSTICAIYNSLAFIFGAQLAKRRTVTLAPQLLSKPFGPVM